MTSIGLPRVGAARRQVALWSWRKIWLKTHLWLGLALGLFLSVIGLTGSALVFFQEIDQALNPQLRIVAAPPEGRAAWRPLEEIADTARRAIPADSYLGWCYWPQNDDGTFLFYYRVDNPRSGKPDTHQVFVDPYLAKVTGTRVWHSSENLLEDAFVAFLFKLHYALLVSGIGDVAVGIIAILAFVSTVSGVVLWWPRNGKWRNAFSVKWPARSERLNYDLHRLAGLFLLPVALAVLLSGVHFNLPQQFKAVVESFSTLTQPEHYRSVASGSALVALDEAIATATRSFPDGRIYAVTMPKPNDGAYIVDQLFPIGWGLDGRRTIYIDQFRGDILQANDPLSGDGDGFIQWQWPLHSGYVYGWPGRIAVFLFGLSWPLLFATGFLRWLQKRRAHNVASARRVNIQSPPGSF
ncbi:PepSY domain-containing protein [Methylocystis sp. MJC1]|jgi:uncharacterized iron-regulated membrane protein|uniref:PepSY-associated TM helix domain-containing protein n=1 Tax=Methylocystis sp. MJC1 TaxID=2654282 RepID=UPI0013EA4C8E|nr:PepSY-associated TM helix domain-containing protein [Methylocystis sp. MJC1]KAF2989171.1 hypothetical protein MJC1_03753 [Methylocystis sp. MJC1]MBU6525875.1 PepSY domain-containing protein [Methylocystis sp. MJC1]UZX12341.1 PepSY domain-containing protein [Methylocystis sp. MJC1]